MNTKPSIDELFERRLVYPDTEAQERLFRLLGIDEKKERLMKMLGILVNPTGLESWAKKYHADRDGLVNIVVRRPPLIVLAGDVGSGKTELAESIGDAVARQEKIDITLFPMSLSTRGQGRVGEMTLLITSAFDYLIEEASRLKSSSGKTRGGMILLVDEADALAQSREAAQMHHEDRAGVNAFIRGIDRLCNKKLPVAVIMCTNRMRAIDPAIKRRSADILIFKRPNELQRYSILKRAFEKLGFSNEEIENLVVETGSKEGRDYGFTFSDLTQRLLPAIVLDAYPKEPITVARALKVAQGLEPTPPFQEDSK